MGFLWRVPLAGGTPERVELAGDQAGFPAVSRAGNQLAYSRFGHGDIWKFEAGKPREDFLYSSLDDSNPQFSPDGKKIAFESGRLGKQQLWVADADGTNRKPLEPGGKGARGSARWSPDSRSIVFDGQEEDGSRAIYVVDADGGQPRFLTSPASTPSWSHDGKWIYFTRQGVSGRSVPK